MKTNAARILDQLGFKYSIVQYEVDDTDLSAETVARKIGLPPEQVFKTLVVRGDRSGVLLAVIPGSSELDLKRLAAVSGDKRVEMVPLKEIQPLTGYVRGGVSPLGTKKKYPVYIDILAQAWDVISVSAGHRGVQILVKPDDLIAASEAIVCDITH